MIIKLSSFFAVLAVLVSCNSTNAKKQKPPSTILENRKSSNSIAIEFCFVPDTLSVQSFQTKASNIEDSFLTLRESLKKFRSFGNNYKKIDSTVIYVTNPLYQQKLSVASGCLEKVKKSPNLLMEQFFVDDFVYSTIEMKDEQMVDVSSFGRSRLMEFEIIGGSEYNPHYIFIVSNVDTDGTYIFFSDGLEKINEGNKTILAFTERVRIHKQFAIPLHFNGELFVPIGHYKIKGKWEE